MKKKVTKVMLATFPIFGVIQPVVSLAAESPTTTSLDRFAQQNLQNYLKNPLFTVDPTTKTVANWRMNNRHDTSPLSYNILTNDSYYQFSKNETLYSMKNLPNGFEQKIKPLTVDAANSITVSQIVQGLTAGKEYIIRITGKAQGEHVEGKIFYPYRGFEVYKTLKWTTEEQTVEIPLTATNNEPTIKLNQQAKITDALAETSVIYTNFAIEEVTKAGSIEEATEAVDALFRYSTKQDLIIGIEKEQLDKAQQLVDELPNSSHKNELIKLMDRAYKLFEAQQLVDNLFEDPTTYETLNPHVTKEQIRQVKRDVETLLFHTTNTEIMAIARIAEMLFDQQAGDQQVREIVEALFKDRNFSELADGITQDDIDEAFAVLEAVTNPDTKAELQQLIEKAQNLFNQS